MADARQQAEWTRAAAMTATLKQAWAGGEWDAESLIPARYRQRRPPPERTPEQKRHDTRCALALLGRALGDPNPLG